MSAVNCSSAATCVYVDASYTIIDAGIMASEWVTVPSGTSPAPVAVDDDDVELWAIRCPKGFDLDALQGVRVGLQPDGPPVALSRAPGYALGPVPAHESANLVGVLPSASDNGWTTAKPFARQFSVTMQASAPEWPPEGN